MKKPALYPLKFHEIYKPYIWGGKNLLKLGKSIGVNETVAESWEISDHDSDISVVKNGKLAGANLKELIAMYDEDISPHTRNNRFPILIKFIDANKKLSVQVHPDDEYARTHESPTELGKTECWYIMEAPAGARLIMGVKRGVSKHDFHTLLRENRIEEGLNYLPVQKGDVLYIKTGTVHALVEGIMVCEIQENSDTTYRLYDWGRTGPDGKPRPLHIQKALDVIHFPTAEEYDTYMKDIFIKFDRKKMNTVHPLVRCRYFNFDYVHYSRDFDLSIEDDHFHALNIINGEGTLISSGGELGLRKGESVLVPRPVQNYSVQTRSIELLKTFL